MANLAQITSSCVCSIVKCAERVKPFAHAKANRHSDRHFRSVSNMRAKRNKEETHMPTLFERGLLVLILFAIAAILISPFADLGPVMMRGFVGIHISSITALAAAGFISLVLPSFGLLSLRSGLRSAALLLLHRAV